MGAVGPCCSPAGANGAENLLRAAAAPEDGAWVSGRERRVAGASTPEGVWADWLARLWIPAWDWRALHRSARRLVVVAPHPDDELLACGGLLAMHARCGGEVLVLAVTDGEASHGTDSRADMAVLARTRQHERMQGLQRLGLPAGAGVARLGLPDGQVAQHAERLCGLLVEALAPADLVVTTWKRDGHPDHDAAGQAALQAGRRVGCRVVMAPVWMWHWAAPADERVPWHRIRCVALDERAMQDKAQAIAAHASQLAARGGAQSPILGADILARSQRAQEYFFI